MTTLAMPKPHGDRGMEGMVAKWYAANTGEMMNEYVELVHEIVSELPSGSSVLEVAPGPGYFCIELTKLGSCAITGLDKNFGDPVGALREMCRVLKPGEHSLIIDLRRDASPS